METFLVISGDRISYHYTATSALEACDLNQWETALPAMAVHKLNPGDEININSYSSVIRLSGVEIDHVG